MYSSREEYPIYEMQPGGSVESDVCILMKRLVRFVGTGGAPHRSLYVKSSNDIAYSNVAHPPPLGNWLGQIWQ